MSAEEVQDSAQTEGVARGAPATAAVARFQAPQLVPKGWAPPSNFQSNGAQSVGGGRRKEETVRV